MFGAVYFSCSGLAGFGLVGFGMRCFQFGFCVVFLLWFCPVRVCRARFPDSFLYMFSGLVWPGSGWSGSDCGVSRFVFVSLLCSGFDRVRVYRFQIELFQVRFWFVFLFCFG